MACQYFVNGNWISENQFKELLNNGLLDNLISDNKVDLKGFKTDSSKVLSKKTEEVTRTSIPATKLASILADEIKNRAGYPINMLSALELNVVRKEDGTIDEDATDFKIPLWASPYASKFESLLTSLVSNKVVKQKLPGNSYVLGSEEGFRIKEGDDAAGVIKNSNIVFTDKFDATKGLQPLRWDPVNKKMLPAQIMIPFKFRNESGEILELSEFTTKGPDGRMMLNMEKIPEKLLQLFGFRIPTQKQNSMAAVEIVGFLPETSGDLVLAPRDFTKQMGSDFDVDKLYTYMYNHFYKDGKLYTNFVKDAGKIEKLLTIAKQQLEDLKEEYKLSKEDRKLIDKYIKEKQEYNEKNEPIPSELAQKVSALIEESMTTEKGKGYPILDEFKNKIDEAVNTISVLNRSYKAARQNEILDIHLKVMLSKNPEVIAAILALDSSGEFKELSIEIDKARSEKGLVEPILSILSETYQRTKFINATAGKNGVGYFSLDSTFNASAQGKDLVMINLTPEMQEELFGTFTEPKTPTAAEILDANLPIATFGTSVSRGDLSNKYTLRSQAIIDQAKMQGRELSSEEKASLKLKSLVIRSLQSSAVDNEKEQILDKLNINDQTFDAIRAMTILGFEEDEISGLLTQEIIWEFVDTIKEARSSLSVFQADIETKIFMDLVKKYDPEGKYDKLDAASLLTLKSKSAEQLLNNVKSTQVSLKVPADKLTPDYNLEQLATLEKFLELTSRGQEINQLQSTINSESKGVPKSLIETEAKVKQIRGITKGPIFNAGNLLGLTQITPAGLAISPKTINGFAAVYGTMFANNVFEKYFPYKKTGFTTLVEELSAHLPRQIKTMRADAEFKQEVFKDIRSFLFANTDTNLFTENPDLERRRLFIDSKDNMSLAHKLSLVQSQAWFQRNGFLNKLDFDLNNNGQISRINFEAATGENLDERNIYDGFIYLLDKNFKVGTFTVDGKRVEYTSRMIAQELVTAAFLEGGNQGAKQYLKYIPISYLKTLGFGEYLSGVPFDFVDTFFGNVSEYGVIYSQPSAFTRQFFQNNPERAKTVTLGMLQGNIVAIPEGHFTLKQELLESNFVEATDPITGEPTMEQTKFVSIYDSKLPGKYALFEFDSLDRVYRRIPTLAGSYGFVQYNSDSKNPTPTERVNRTAPSPAPQIPAPGYTIPNIPTKPTQTFTNGVVNNSTPLTGTKSLNISEKLSGTKEAIDDLLNNLADSTDISNLNSHLIETLRSLQLPADFKVVYDNNISGRGSFNTDNNTLTINLAHPTNQSVDNLATVVTHELIHAHTSKVIKQYLSGDTSSLTKEQIQSIENLQDLQSKYIETLVAQEGPERLNQFTELYSNWKNAQANFGANSTEANTEYKKLQSFLEAGDLSKYYGAIKLTEFVTMAMTDPGFQERLNNIKDEAGVSMWEKIKSAILEILNALGLDVQPGSALAYAIKESMDLIQANQEELKKNLIETKEFVEFGTKYKFEVDSNDKVTKAEFAQGDFSVFKAMNPANGQKKYDDLKSKPATAVTEVAKKPTISKVKNNPSEYINYSGAAEGADTVWETVGKEFGIGQQVNYRPKDLQNLTPERQQEIEKSYQRAVVTLGRKPLAYDWQNPNAKNAEGKSLYYSGGLVRRDYLQAEKADAIFAIVEGFDLINGNYVPKGGTGYATMMAVEMQKPVFIFNQTDNQWYEAKYLSKEEGNGFYGFEQTSIPTLTPNFAGIGTRQINEAGKQAIRDVYTNTFEINKNVEEVSGFIPKYEIFPGVFANEGQTIALDKMANFLASDQEQFLLKGRGGTGKTTIVKMVMDRSGVSSSAILGTTVSDEARGILASNLPGTIKTKTLAGALGLVPDYNTRTGELYFRERNAKEQADFDSKGKRDPIENARLIIVDEVSMVGNDLYEILMRKKRSDAKVIFMGDNAQIPPINADGKSQDSPVFGLLEGTDNFAELSERMRQGEESPILPVTDVFAENIEAIQRGETGKDNPLINRTSKFDENTNSGVLFTNNRQEVVDAFVADFKNDPNNLRNAVIIGARNEVVDNFAKLVRDELFNNPTDPYVIGDVVRVNSPFMEGKEVKYANGFKGKVTNVKSLGIDPFLNIEKFELTVEYEKMDIGGKMVKSTTTMVTISPEDKKAFKSMLNALAAKAKARVIPWPTFYGVKESIVDLGYNYAMTSHKVQGSTYKNVYVLEDDIMSFPGGKLQQNRMMYTAVSRPTTKLVVYSANNKPAGKAFSMSSLQGAIDLTQYTTPNQAYGEDEGYVPSSEKDNSDYYNDWEAYQQMRNQEEDLLAESPISRDAIEKYLLICGK